MYFWEVSNSKLLFLCNLFKNDYYLIIKNEVSDVNINKDLI